MSLSHDIISEFVKVTNNNKEKPKEGIVYATIVQGSDGKYVKIDGSDLLTPADTTTDIEDGERVTVMIKDHKATVTGNVTSPSASGNRVDKVVETVTEQIGVFETVVADKVSTNELEAYKATIEYLVAGKAEIEDLEAINATIENLKVKDAEIENLVADKATIEDLEATNAVIENLKVKDAEIENAVVENLEATKADIQILNADFAQIKTLVSGNLTSDNILSFNITADKVTMEDAFIKDAMIANVNAAKINAGRINTNSVVIGSEDGGMSISGATQQFTDKNGNVRIQIGRDASNDFTFALYGEDGQGQLINQNGITASAISDGIIVNDMISDDASISGGKLDISSVVTEINNDNTTTIKSNKIYLDEQNQSLEVAFKSLKTQVDTIKDIDSDLTTITDKIQSNTSKIEANKSSISTLLAEDAAIKKQVTDLEGNVVETTNTLTSKYTSLQQNLDGFKTTVNNTYATKTSVNDVKNNLSSNYSTTSAMNSAINQKVDEISASISSTYATKNEVKTIDNNIKANYSTTEQMSSAISVAKNEINLGISQVYETKTEVTNKVGDAINKVQIGGRNLIIRNTETKNYYIGMDGSLSKADGYGVSDYIKVDSGESLAFSKKDSPTTDDYFRWAWYGNDKTYINRTPNNSNKFIWVVPSGAAYVRISYPLDCYPKVERGTKHTDWTPAPEDVDTSINNAITTSKNYTDSQIKISKDAIELGVSKTYETKSSVSSQVSTALTSAKSYADTKKSEAISTASSDATSKANNALNSAKSYADTKKSEAITSANNTLNTTIANYYTKAQTDSQINIAKDAINLGVSETYETKTEVSNKINAIQVGGRNLLPRARTFENWQGVGQNGVKVVKDGFKTGMNSLKFAQGGEAIVDNELQKKALKNLANTHMIVTNPEDSAYSLYPNPPKGSTFNSVNRDGSLRKGEISSNGSCWAIISAYKYYTEVPTSSAIEQKLLQIMKDCADFMCDNLSVGRFNSMNFEFIDTSYKYSSKTRAGWTVGTYKELYLSTMFLQVKSLTYAYKIHKNQRYLDTAYKVLDSLYNVQIYIKDKVAKGDLPTEADGAFYEYLACDNLSSSNRFSGSTRILPLGMGYYISQAIDTLIEIVGDNERTTAKGDSYRPSTIKTEYAKFLSSMIKTGNLTAKPTNLPYGHYYKSEDGTFKLGNWNFIDNAFGDEWFVGDVVCYTIIGLASLGFKTEARQYMNAYYSLKVPNSSGRFAGDIVFYDRIDFSTGTHLPDDDSVSITYTALYMETGVILKEMTHVENCANTLLKWQVSEPNNIKVDGAYMWDISKDTSSLELKSYGEIVNSEFFKYLSPQKIRNRATTASVSTTLTSNIVGKEFALSGWLKASDWNALASGLNACLKIGGETYASLKLSDVIKNNNWTRFELLGSVEKEDEILTFELINNTSTTVEVAVLKLEKGNKITDFTDAPEDVEDNIVTSKNDAISSANNTLATTIANYYTKTQTDSQIKIAKDAINLGVSETYETKTNVTSKVNSAISTASSDATTKANNALTSAKSYADTKKSEAINSANNTLNTTIANYYTKSQTDSQINVAKNAITQSVSNTYETKTNVQNKIDAIQVGGTNLVKQSKLLTDVTSLGGWHATETGNEGFKKLEIVTTDTSWQECSVPLYTEINTITKAVTISFEYQETTSELLLFSLGAYNGGTRLAETTNVTVSSGFKVISTNNGWKTVYCTFDPTSINGRREANQYRIQFKKVSGKTGTINVRKLKLEVGTKATTWSPAPEDMETTVSNLTQRVSTAEQKITDTAITNVVKQNFYTKTETNNQITSKGYQTASQVQQTVDSLQLKFTQSGGYNLFLNSGFKKGTSYWGTHTHNSPTGGSIGITTSAGEWGFPDASVNCIHIRLSNQSGIEYGISQAVKTTIGKKYTISFYYAGHRLNSANLIVRNSNSSWLASKAITSFPSGGNGNANNWSKHTLTFTANATSHNINIVIVSAADNGYLWVAKPMVVEGELDLPYSPNPNEIYDGITEINKDGVTVRSNNAYTNFNSAGMNSFNNSGQQTLGIRNGGITFHPYNTNQLGAYVTQSALWSGSVSANGLAISTANNGTYISLGTSSLSDANTSLSMDQALTISASDNFQPKGINFWKNVHAHGYGIRQLAHLQLAGSAPIQFDYLNTSPSTIYEATSSGHSLYVMGGYQMHLGCMDGTGTPKGLIWMQNSTNTHSYTHWNFHNYTMYNMKTATSYANTLTNRYIETYGINSNVDGIRYLYRNIELVDGVGIRNLPNGYKGCPYDIVSIVCKGRGHAWVECEDEYRFIINGDCKSVNVEIIIYPTDGVMTMSSLAPDESPTLEDLPKRNISEQPVIITNEDFISVESEQE